MSDDRMKMIKSAIRLAYEQIDATSALSGKLYEHLMKEHNGNKEEAAKTLARNFLEDAADEMTMEI